MHIGRDIGLGEAEIWDLYYTLLLKDLGCSSNAARICELYLTDDLAFKRDFKTIDDSLPQVLRFVLSHTGLKAGLAERFRALVNIFQNSGEIAQELIETRCQRGAEIARKMRFSEAVAQGIHNLDEHWDGNGLPKAWRRAIPLFSRIALMAQVVDVFHIAAARAAKHEIGQRAGTWFDPHLVEASNRVAALPAFWACWLAGPGAGDLRAGAGAALASSTKTISTTSPPRSRRSWTPRAPTPAATASACRCSPT